MSVHLFVVKISTDSMMKFKTRNNCQPIIPISEKDRLSKQPGPQLVEAPKGPLPRL